MGRSVVLLENHFNMFKSLNIPLKITLFFFLTCALTTVFQAQAQEAKFQDWSVICEKDFCAASTKDQRNNTHNLTLRRDNSAKALWNFSVALPRDTGRMEPKNIRVAGHRPADLKRKRDFTLSNDHHTVNFTDSGTIQLVFRRIIDGRRLFIDFKNSKNRTIRASFSLNGLSAALLYIDEQQNRIASRRQISLTLERPVTLKKTAEELAFLNHQTTNDPEICDLKAQELYAAGVSVEKLDENNHLVIIPCFLAAYNSGARLFLVQEKEQKSILLLWAHYTQLTGWSGTDILSNVSFDNQTNKITMIHKGRGLGDCGVFAQWHWQKDFFIMKELRAKENCDGKNDEWPLIYKGQN